MPLLYPPQPPSGWPTPASCSICLWLPFFSLLCNAWALPILDSDTQEVMPVWLAAPLGGSEGQVSFSITAFGQEFVLLLEPDASFLAPGLRIQHLGRKVPLGFPAEEDARLRKCFYSGTVNAEPDSLVAVSLCQGIHGSFLVDGDKYLIQPQGQRSGDPLLQVHQLQKRGWTKEGAEDLPEGEAQEDPNITRSRTKRFTSEARYVETLLVADASMVQFYGDDLQVSCHSWWLLPFLKEERRDID